jgi:hypothetical protein
MALSGCGKRLDMVSDEPPAEEARFRRHDRAGKIMPCA